MSAMGPLGNTDLGAAIKKSLHEHWKMFLIEGIVLVVLGAAAIIIPPLAGLAATIYIGWVFVIAGAVGLWATTRTRGAPGFGWAMLSAILAIAAGLLLLWNPVQGLFTLTYVMIAFFVIDGAAMIFLSIAHRRELSGRWEWILFNGIIDLILAAIILSGYPASFSWALGLLLGIDLVFGGSSLIAMALAAREG